MSYGYVPSAPPTAPPVEPYNHAGPYNQYQPIKEVEKSTDVGNDRTVTVPGLSEYHIEPDQGK